MNGWGTEGGVGGVAAAGGVGAAGSEMLVGIIRSRSRHVVKLSVLDDSFGGDREDQIEGRWPFPTSMG